MWLVREYSGELTFLSMKNEAMRHVHAWPPCRITVLKCLSSSWTKTRGCSLDQIWLMAVVVINNSSRSDIATGWDDQVFEALWVLLFRDSSRERKMHIVELSRVNM